MIFMYEEYWSHWKLFLTGYDAPVVSEEKNVELKVEQDLK
jgi:hypothetical protein